jgi:hypothetical protein
MPKAGMHVLRNHPILVAAGAGAILGAAYTALIEIGGLTNGNSSAVLPLLFPAAHGSSAGQMNAVQTAGLLLIEMSGNMLGFAALFSIPVAIAVGVRRLFKGRRG